jgi:homoserine dehydrogenase
VSEPLGIGIAGLGTVGRGVVRLIGEQGTLLSRRCGREIVVRAVSARDRDRDRGIDLSAYEWHDDAATLATAEGVDIVVELIGGEDGIAKAVVEAALHNGRHVVTANKALVARHGTALARMAEGAELSLNFEAAVAGGIPIVKVLREGLSANRFHRVYGILNGTCNYILTQMQETGRDFAEVLAEAQELGYAEADPAFDVDGVDAAHKLAILTSLAYGSRVDFDSIYIEGIRGVEAIDIGFAAELDYRIKLLAIARLTETGIEQRVHPCMVPARTPIAGVSGVFNAVVAEGDFVDRTVYEGRGAGEGPTASAVVADIMDIARGSRLPTFSVPAEALQAIPPSPIARHSGPYYVRLTVVDQPGVIADISTIFRDQAISIESLLQRGRAPEEAVPVVMITHDTEEAAMVEALQAIAEIPAVLAEPKMIRIEML